MDAHAIAKELVDNASALNEQLIEKFAKALTVAYEEGHTSYEATPKVKSTPEPHIRENGALARESEATDARPKIKSEAGEYKTWQSGEEKKTDAKPAPRGKAEPVRHAR